MTKKDLIDKVMQKNQGMTLRDAGVVVNTLLDQIITALAQFHKS
jgi:nucleoid DNA-binding protein